VGEETIFDRIIAGEIPADIVYRDERAVAFRDVNPQAPVHLLVVPVRPLAGLQVAEEGDADLLGHLMCVAAKVAAQEGLAESGYRCVINAGPDGGQEVPHLHIHLLGGRALGWPPG